MTKVQESKENKIFVVNEGRDAIIGEVDESWKESLAQQSALRGRSFRLSWLETEVESPVTLPNRADINVTNKSALITFRPIAFPLVKEARTSVEIKPTACKLDEVPFFIRYDPAKSLEWAFTEA